MVAADRRSRRRFPRWLFLAVLVTVVALAVNSVASTSSGGTAPRVAYLDAVRPALQSSADQGGDLTALREQGAGMGPDALRALLAKLRVGAAANVRTVRRVPPPRSWTEAQGFLLTALITRADAVERLAATLSRAAVPPAEADIAALVDVGRRLVVADAAYELFRARVPRSVQPPLPPATWVRDPQQWDRPAVASFLASLQAAAAVGPVHDVSLLTFSTEPVPVGQEGDVVVLPQARALRVQVVVANAGNTPERKVPVTATVTDATGAARSQRGVIDLAPGERTTVTLGGLPLPGGGPARLDVSVGPVTGEAAVADNGRSLTFLVR